MPGLQGVPSYCRPGGCLGAGTTSRSSGRRCWPPLRAPGTGGAATRVDVPASTVRDWIHAARDGAAGLISAVSGVIEAAGARLHPPQAPPVWAARRLSEAVAALGVAARGFVLDLATPRPPGPGGRPSGIDYLGILAERHRQHIHHQLRVVDPTGALAGLRGWPLINVLSRGRLLTCGPAG